MTKLLRHHVETLRLRPDAPWPSEQAQAHAEIAARTRSSNLGGWAVTDKAGRCVAFGFSSVTMGAVLRVLGRSYPTSDVGEFKLGVPMPMFFGMARFTENLNVIESFMPKALVMFVVDVKFPGAVLASLACTKSGVDCVEAKRLPMVTSQIFLIAIFFFPSHIFPLTRRSSGTVRKRPAP